MSNVMKAFLRDEAGATAIEYALIAALVSVAIISGATTLGANLSATYNAVANKVTVAG